MDKQFDIALKSLRNGDFKKAKSLFLNLSEDIKSSRRITNIFIKNYEILSNLRNCKRDFIPISDMCNKECFICGSKELEISPYPFFASPLFLNTFLVLCKCCQTSFVPKLSFELSDYYKSEYANTVQTFRAKKYTKFYDAENPLWTTDGGKRFLRRADFFLDKAKTALNKSSFNKILDIGPGMGITLSKINAKIKHACELDEYSIKVLEEELGIKCIDFGNLKGGYELIISSHVLEHFFCDEILVQLKTLYKKLIKGGVFLIEVPFGSDQINRLKEGSRNNNRLEPHTVNFSSLGLLILMMKAGFSVEEISLCESSKRLLNETTSFNHYLDGVKILDYKPMFLVARKL
jgi:hypothetical protein